jgi:hypothetical protein
MGSHTTNRLVVVERAFVANMAESINMCVAVTVAFTAQKVQDKMWLPLGNIDIMIMGNVMKGWMRIIRASDFVDGYGK